MSKIYKSNFLLLLTLLLSIREEYANSIQEQSKIEIKPQFQNNSEESTKTIITTMSVINEISSEEDGENYKLLEKISSENTEKPNVQRGIRNILNDSNQLQCISCVGNVHSNDEDKCYIGELEHFVNCHNGEECFTELHPQYIKRGCMSRSRLNRTFICKCPLCNDKPFDDVSSFVYKTIRDWEYDNKRLHTAVIGMDLLCKVCDTKGTNKIFEKACKMGKESDYMVCGHNQLCYTNIDQEIDFVSRGCISKPAFNSLHYFCNQTKCNTTPYQKIGIIIPEDLTMKTSLSISHPLKSSILEVNLITTLLLFYVE